MRKNIFAMLVSLVFLLSFLWIAPPPAAAFSVNLPLGTPVYQPKDAAPADAKTRQAAKKDGVYGCIMDSETRTPLARVTLEMKNANFGLGYYKVVSDASGNFYIPDFIKHIRYRIEVGAPGYINYTQTYEVSSGRHDIFLIKEGIVGGQIVDSKNRSLSGVEVKLESVYKRDYREDHDDEEDIRYRPVFFTTGKDGKYRFGKLPQGEYLATFKKAGHITETARISNVRPGDRLNVPMQMFRNASISGKIFIADVQIGAPNIDMVIEGRSQGATVSNIDGSYRIEDIKPGSYKLTLSHRGFISLSNDKIDIREGENKKALNFTLKPKNPEIEVYSDRYTFVIGQQAGFNLKSFRLEKVKFRIYQLPMEIALRGRTDSAAIRPQTEGLKLIREWDEGIKDFNPYDWQHQYVDITEPLPSGSYCIEVIGAGNVINRKFFSITSIGVVVKRSQNTLLAYATDLTSNKPVGGAPILIFDATVPAQVEPPPPSPDENASNEEGREGNDEGSDDTAEPAVAGKKRASHQYNPPSRLEDLPVKIMTRTVTGENGTAQLNTAPDKPLTLMVIAKDGSFAVCNTGSPEHFDREKEKIFIYTDRPVYRAGDEVFYKVIGKSMGTASAPLATQKLFYIIRNNETQETVDQGSFTLDTWGTHQKSWKLSSDTHLGTYEIRVGPSENNLYSLGTFYVDQYRKPDFKIDLTPARDYFINRDSVEFKVEAKYLFGAPLKNALVRYRFYESRLRDNDTKYWWEEDEGPSRSFNKVKLEGDKYLNENGMTLLKISAGDLPYDRDITLEVTIVDQSNASVTSSTTVKVGRGDYYIKIHPSQSFFAEREKKGIEIRALSHTGKPAAATLDVKVFRYVWRPFHRLYLHDAKPVFAQKVSTNAEGVAHVELPDKFDFYGEYDIVAEGKDSRGNLITASRVIWIYSESAAHVESRFKNLELSVGETVLEKPGEITCLIKSRYTDAHVLLTIEGKDIYEKRVIPMTGNVMPVKLQIKNAYTPNVFITATMQRGRALFTSSEEVAIAGQGVNMNIRLKPDKEKYLPGEKIKIAITATDEAGKALKGDLSLGVVDEAIYLIRRDHTLKLRDFFYSKNSNWVLTNYSYPFTILAGVGKDGKVKIREKFADTAYWNAGIKTDERGQAMVEFVLPDNLTTWRMTARGHDLTGRVGEKKNEFLVTQDLIARIGKPRFFIEGDKLSLIGIVNSNTSRGLTRVKPEFRADNKILPSDDKVKLSLPAFGAASLYYPFNVPDNKTSVDLFFQALGDAEAKDALRISLPVYSRGMSYKLYGTGDMGDNRTVLLTPIKDTDDFEYRPEEISVTVNPSPIHQLLRGADYLANFPYGCIEQTLNGFMPALALQSLLKQKGLPVAANEKLNDKINAGIDKILRYQNSDGTWGWWSGDSANEFITGYVLYALHLARSMGYNVDKAPIDRALSAVQMMLQNRVVNNDDGRSFLFNAFTLWGGWNPDAYLEFARNPRLNNYSRAYFIMALANAEKTLKTASDKAIVKNMTDLQLTALKAAQKRDRYGVYWEHDRHQLWGWPGGNTEITAHVLSALAAVHDRTTLPGEIVKSLMKRSKGPAWKSTKETAAVILSICKYYGQLGQTNPEWGKVSFKMNGRDLTTIDYDSRRIDEPHKLTRIVKLPRNKKTDSFRVEASGSASSDITFNLTVNGNLYFRENRLHLLSQSAQTSLLEAGKNLFGGIKDTFTSFIKSQDSMIRSINNGIEITRSYALVARVRDMNNHEYLVPQPIDEKRGLKIGDEILVTLKFRTLENFEYLVLEDYLPAGFEVVKKNVFDDYKPYTHSERWDNRMVFFFTSLSKNNIHEVAYTLRAELPGQFLARPARMECMYEPGIQGWSSPAKFSVLKK